MEQKRILVVGCGRVGSKVARLFLERGFEVSAISRSVNPDLPVAPMFTFFREEIAPESAFIEQLSLHGCSAVVICLPPSVGQAVFEIVFSALGGSGCGSVIMISSTSVYGDLQGDVTERDVPTVQNARGQRQAEVEKLMPEHVPHGTILRCGGLMGNGRHPGLFFPSGQGAGSGSEPVNMVHEADVARAVVHCFDQGLTGIFNCVFPLHPSRNEFYAMASEAIGRQPVTFERNDAVGKIVSSAKLLGTGFEFSHDIRDFN